MQLIEKSVASMVEKSSKHILTNGLTILCLPIDTAPKVSMQLWYGVGSKDELRGQKGLAHFLEHMLFKGTKKLSEVDMVQATDKLSGHCNAFTSYDYTAYIFDFPKDNWKHGLEMLADTMRNCTFKQELLDSELAAVVQEIKLYKDDYESCLEEEMITALFDDHPYHYPIIGYKQDLWNATRQEMLDFYHKHYIPNNATLVVVGDVSVAEVIEAATRYFAPIKPDYSYKKPALYKKQDLMAKSVVLYRDVQQVFACVSFVVPGLKEGQGYILDLICWLLANGRGSRLYKKLVNQLELVTDIAAYTEDLFDHGVLFITFNPKKVDDVSYVQQLILQEIKSIIDHGIGQRELLRAIKQTQTDYVSLFEDYEELASEWGRTALAIDSRYFLTYLNTPVEIAEEKIREILSQYCRPILMNTGIVMPLSDAELEHWSTLQDEIDQQAEQALLHRKRESVLEAPRYTTTIIPAEPPVLSFPQACTVPLSNGSLLLYCDRSTMQDGAQNEQRKCLPTINIIIELKARYVDTFATQGLYNFVMALLLEGTQRYTAEQLADEFETYGMTVGSSPGFIELHMLSSDLDHGLMLLKEMVCHPLFEPAAIERVREQILAEIKEYWDDSFSCIDQIAKNTVYNDHPHAYNLLGTIDSITAITRDDIVNFYKKYITPQEALIAVVGDCGRYNVPQLFEDILRYWSGEKISATVFPAIKPSKSRVINYPMHRDQVALCLAGLSIARTDKRYDALMIFDQTFSGGAQGSMNSKLFQLREQSGLFYTINSSVLAYADQEPGMIMIKTLISLDTIDEVENKIRQTITTTINDLSSDEVKQAVTILINAINEQVESNKQLAHAVLFLQRYKLSADYFDTRIQKLSTITVEDIQKAIIPLMSDNKLYCIRVGRIEEFIKEGLANDA